MEDSEKITIITIIIVSLFAFWFFLSGAWYRFNDWADEKAQGGKIIVINGLKHLKIENVK